MISVNTGYLLQGCVVVKKFYSQGLTLSLAHLCFSGSPEVIHLYAFVVNVTFINMTKQHIV